MSHYFKSFELNFPWYDDPVPTLDPWSLNRSVWLCRVKVLSSEDV